VCPRQQARADWSAAGRRPTRLAVGRRACGQLEQARARHVDVPSPARETPAAYNDYPGRHPRDAVTPAPVPSGSASGAALAMVARTALRHLASGRHTLVSRG